MECKEQLFDSKIKKWIYWNISRMECKAKCQANISAFKFIGIYPEWNVKGESYIFVVGFHIIGIYPEWSCRDT